MYPDEHSSFLVFYKRQICAHAHVRRGTDRQTDRQTIAATCYPPFNSVHFKCDGEKMIVYKKQTSSG
jgi:hypothetical protein